MVGSTTRDFDDQILGQPCMQFEILKTLPTSDPKGSTPASHRSGPSSHTHSSVEIKLLTEELDMEPVPDLCSDAGSDDESDYEDPFLSSPGHADPGSVFRRPMAPLPRTSKSQHPAPTLTIVQQHSLDPSARTALYWCPPTLLDSPTIKEEPGLLPNFLFRHPSPKRKRVADSVGTKRRKNSRDTTYSDTNAPFDFDPYNHSARYGCPIPNSMCNHAIYNPACDTRLERCERIRHIPMYHDGHYYCPIVVNGRRCQHYLDRVTDFMWHLLRADHDEKKFFCRCGGTAFTRPDALRRHVKSKNAKEPGMHVSVTKEEWMQVRHWQGAASG